MSAGKRSRYNQLLRLFNFEWSGVGHSCMERGGFETQRAESVTPASDD